MGLPLQRCLAGGGSGSRLGCFTCSSCLFPACPHRSRLVPAVPRQAVGVCMGTVQTVCRCGVPWLGPSCTSCYSGHRAESCGSVCTAKLGAEGKCWSIGSCVDSAALYLSPCTALALQVLDEIHHLTLAPVAASVR